MIKKKFIVSDIGDITIVVIMQNSRQKNGLQCKPDGLQGTFLGEWIKHAFFMEYYDTYITNQFHVPRF